MTPFVLATIVEGHGEVSSIPILVRRGWPHLHCARPIRVKRYGILKADELERYAKIANANIVEKGGVGAVLLILDAEQDCPVNLAKALSARLRAALGTRFASCVIANKATESWLVAGDKDAPAVEDELRQAPVWLQRKLGTYSKVIDQARLASSVDLQLAAQRSRSFRRFTKVLDELSQGAH
jgi:hypothetical protein